MQRQPFADFQNTAVRPLRILFVTPEVEPFVKVGGLADMTGALPKELAALGHDVRIVCPAYSSVKDHGPRTARHEPLGVDVGPQTHWARTWETFLPDTGVAVYLLEHDGFFGRAEVYAGPWGSHGDNDLRYAFLCRAALALCQQLNWIPDVVHGHDWTTGLLPVYLNTTLQHTPLGRIASIFTVHNLEHQGYADRRVLDFARLPLAEFRNDSVESYGAVNMMKAGLYHSTKLTTVSPTYAQEIQTPAGGWGLDSVLRHRARDLVGIVNGIDTDAWNPAVDRFLPAHYGASNLAGKAHCKAALQHRLNLTVDSHVAVFGVVARFVSQKGLDLLADVLPDIVQQMHVQFAILGAGEPVLEQFFRSAASQYAGRVGVHVGYDNELAHLIQAGSDCFVMPSRAEPCGLTQMYAMRYGTLPVARAPGGLIDTIAQYIGGTTQGDGFLFTQATGRALHDTVGWATATYYDKPRDFARLQRNAMAQDFSWKRSAAQYIDVYHSAIEQRTGAPVH